MQQNADRKWKANRNGNDDMGAGTGTDYAAVDGYNMNADRNSDYENAGTMEAADTAGGVRTAINGSGVMARPVTLGRENDDEITIDLREAFGVIRHWLWLILVVAIAFGAAAYCFSKFVLPEEFQSTTKIYVLDKKSNTDSGQSTYSDLQVGSQLTKDYAELITSRNVIEKVIADNGLNDLYDYKTFLSKVSVDTPTDTRIVSITVTDHDPVLAQTIANSIRTEAADLIISTMQIDAVNTYEEANLPTKKSAPNCGKWAVIAAFIGALLVSALVVLRYILDDTVKTGEDVERYLGLSVLAMIPLDENISAAAVQGKKKHQKNSKSSKKEQEPQRRQEEKPPTWQRVMREIKASEEEWSRSEFKSRPTAAQNARGKKGNSGESFRQSVVLQDGKMSFQTREAYKTLRSNIEFSGRDVHVISVTSCTPNEGKSEVSYELARSFAENQNKVLMIDADLRKSVMRERLRSGKVRYGLANYLVGQCTMEEAVCTTNQQGFDVMQAGPTTPTPSELLNSDNFTQLLTEAREVYDYVIVDTPPLGSVIDAAIIGKKCDGIMLVISSGNISYRFAQSVLNQLLRAGCRVLGCVLNKVEIDGGKGYYYVNYLKKYSKTYY